MMTGDGESQPVEGVDALDDLAEALVPEEEGKQRAAAEVGEEAEDEQEVEEAADEDEGDEDEQDEQTFTIKIDGKEVTVKQSELIELGQKGLDYSKKTMAVAEDRKVVEKEKARAAEVRQRAEQALTETVNQLTAYQQYMEAQVGQPPPISLAQQDAAQYLAQKELYESRRGQLQQASAEIQRLQEAQHQQRQAALLQEAESTESALRDTLPGWNDESLKELSTYMTGLGMKLDMNETFVSKGLWEMAHKAKAYDAIQTRKAQMKPTEKLAKVIKPGANNTTGKAALRAKQEAAFNKNPSVDALADLL